MGHCLPKEVKEIIEKINMEMLSAFAGIDEERHQKIIKGVLHKESEE